MKRLLILFVLLFAACSTKEDFSASSFFIYGEAAENTSESDKIALMQVYDTDNHIVDSIFEAYLSFTSGSFTIKDSNNTVWTLSDDGRISKNAGQSSFSDSGIYRIRIDFGAKTWSKVKINSISYHPFFGSGSLVVAKYEGRGSWLLENLSLETNGSEIKYYRFDVDTDKPEELAYLVYTSNSNSTDPKSYTSQYQNIREIGQNDIDLNIDGSTASWRFQASDNGPAKITLKLYKHQSRYTHTVEKYVPRSPAAFIGDSITERWNHSGSGHPHFFSDNSYLNFGISGQTSKQILDRFYKDVVSVKPICTVILCGTNDIAGNQGVTTNSYILNNISSMATMAEKADIKVILCSVLPCDSYYWKPEIKPQNRIDDLNAKIQKLAKDKGYVYVDYFSAMVDNNRALKKEYQEDPCHPNKAGYDVMEAIIKPVIDKVIENES